MFTYKIETRHADRGGPDHTVLIRRAESTIPIGVGCGTTLERALRSARAERAAPFEASPHAVPLEALLACGLEPYRVHPDGAMTALQADTLRLVSEPKSGIVYVLVGAGMVIAELRLDEVAWKGRKAP